MTRKTPATKKGKQEIQSAPQSDAAALEPLTRPCPICGKPATVEMRPFCSKRCADIDLHRWLGGTYAIPAVENDDDESSDHEGEG